MSYQKLIHEYLDEGLESPREDVLFAELSSNPEMRGEFNQQVKLHTLAKNDMGTISPPVESTNMIFTTLGFSIPSPEDARTPVSDSRPEGKAAKPGFASSWNRYITTISTAVVSAVITTLIVLNLQDQPSAKYSENNLTAAPLVSSVETMPSSNIAEGLSKITEETVVNHTVFANADNHRTVAGQRYNPYGNQFFQPDNTDSSTPNDTEENIDKKTTIAKVDRDEVLFNQLGNINSGMTLIPGPMSVNQPGFVLPSNNDPGLLENFEVTLRSLPGKDYFIASNLDIEGGIDVLYKLNDFILVGFEGGYESFPMEYTSNAQDGQPRYNQQNEGLFWIGPSAKFQYPGLLGDNLTPFAQLTGAYIQASPNYIARGRIGMKVRLYNNLNVNAGYDLVYVPLSDGMENDTYFKNGFSFGISYGK